MAAIAYLGNTRWPWCTETHVTEALTALGHDVTPLQEDEVTVPDIEAAATDADLFLFTRTWGCHPAADMHAMLDRLRSTGTPTASYHLDLYIGLPRETTIAGDPFWSTDCVFHPDGSPAAAVHLPSYGVNRHFPMWPCVSAAECYPGTPRPEFNHDIIFVGSALPYSHTREWPFRDQLVTTLTLRYGPDRFGHYGPGGFRTVRNGIDGDPSALNDLYASARVVVGDYIDRPGYVSDRLTETLGRGGLLVFPRTSAVTQLGYVDYRTSRADDAHYIGYTPGDLGDLDTAISLALTLPDLERDTIRDAAIAHTARYHTFTERMAVLLRVMGVE